MLGRLRLIAVPLVLLAFASPAHATDRAAVVAAAEEKVTRDEVALIVGEDGVVHAKETITYDFGSGGDGFNRTFVTRIPDTEVRDRVFRVQAVKVSSPYTSSVSEDDERTVVKVKGPERTGPQIVILEYDVVGTILPQGRNQEFRWSAVGGWDVPVAEASVTAVARTTIRNVNCFTGSVTSVIGCTEFSTGDDKTRAKYGQQNMLPDEHLTVVAGLPLNSTSGAPMYADRKTLSSAFTVNAATSSALGGALLLLLAGLGLLWVARGRDKKADTSARSPMSGAEFEPPQGVRPGQIGTLIDEQADVIDVTASIIDLAVRGYLLVEEEEGRGDWTLRKIKRPVNDLQPYEQLLYDGLFDGRETVKLSDLGGTFSAKLAEVRRALYADMVTQGWFARRPDAVRSRWTIAGYALTVAGIVATIALAILTEFALIGIAMIVFGATLAFFGRHMPAKTAKGSTVLAETLGFRAYLQGGEVKDVPDRQKIALFSRFLPYAVVFDTVAPWAKTIETSGVEGGDNLYWYEGPAEWDLAKFAESMRVFTFTLSGAISQSRPFVGR